jgi:arylsulfatase A-like enzyme
MRNQIGKKNRVKTNLNSKNVLIVVFDAWSAHNISLLGYPRDTTPNLNRLSEQAIVYHNHYSTAPWTVPGTASLLTGTYPWTNRAIDPGGVIEEFQTKNLFNSFKTQGYDTIACTQNPYANILLKQFKNDIDVLLPIEKLFLNYDPLFGKLFENDEWASALAQNQIFLDGDNVSNSLLLANVIREEIKKQVQKIIDKFVKEFPRKPPSLHKFNYYFLLEDAIDWVLNKLENYPYNFLGYFHFFPPHLPYRTRQEFINIFDDGWKPIPKPEHIFSAGEPEKKSLKYRQYYDEYIAYLDSEFARLFERLKNLDLLEDTWLILTSDHGERFERGTLKHQDYLLHDPVIKIPLVIFPPGQKERVDIYLRTSSIDILPTLLNITGQSIPDWCEGEILPPYQTAEYKSKRSVFALKPKQSLPTSKLNKGAYVIFKDNYKLIYYSGIDETKTYDPYFELFDIHNDPEELNNLYSSKKPIAVDLLQELLSKREEADAPYN